MNEEIAARFARETAEHQMTVLHDDGLYRHLQFQNPKHSAYWFDLITVPGALIFRGDGDSFVFSRIDDMFEFFRGPVGRVNPQYWQEKVTDGHDRAVKYDQELLAACVKETISEYYEGATIPADLEDAVRRDVLDEFVGDESVDRQLVERFRFWSDPEDEYAYPPKAPDFEFTDVWEWTTRDYDWWFLWACQAIVWGIAYHDSGARPSFPEPKASTPTAPRKEAPGRRSVVDVHLPELQEAGR